MKRTLSADSLHEIATRLELAHKALDRRYPGFSGERRPVHVVYGGAHLFKQGTSRRLGDLALRSLDEFAPDFASFARAVGLAGADRLPSSTEAIAAIAKSLDTDAEALARENFPAWLACTVYRRVREKLQREPVEDYRIDFEDGYGNRPDAEEDAHAVSAAAELAAVFRSGQAPAFIGLRVKPLSESLRERSLRTLDIFLTELAARAPNALPGHLRITLPKVTVPDEVWVLADVCSRLEPLLNFEPGALRIEIMIESPRAVFNERGEAAPLALVGAARGRCVGLHFGPYDYTSSLEMAAVQAPGTLFASDFAREVMHVAVAGAGVALADGPVNIMPIPPYRPAKDGGSLTAAQQEENRAVVHRAWRLHFEAVRRAMSYGFYQGWDLHPAQLPSRYAAVYSFFLGNLDLTSRRLRNFIEAAAQATRLGQVFDDAAMAQGLLNYFVQAVNCGAVTAAEVQSRTTLSLADLRSGSFLYILASRK
jgi:citrate lyase beta subunit